MFAIEEYEMHCFIFCLFVCLFFCGGWVVRGKGLRSNARISSKINSISLNVNSATKYGLKVRFDSTHDYLPLTHVY